MKYISTRGEAPVQGFEDVLLAGLASDGGLYLPQTWPQMSQDDIASLAGLPYPELALKVILPFVGDDLRVDELQDMLNEAYGSFAHKAIAPLVQLDSNDFLLELFHGPTLAFKDFAMQLLARLMDRALSKRGRRATIVGATSGDTGGAAIEAFRGRDNIDVFILHPHRKVTEVQRRQMTTPSEDNVHNIALEGNFDDCQALLKNMFNDAELRQTLQLAGVNSINWARIMGQIPYYFAAATALGAPHREVSFCVPSGNLGDIFAGYVAQKMGLPIGKLIIATNANDILARTLETGRYEAREAVATDSPSMDIQVSSNFERLLFELSGHDSAWLNGFMKQFSDTGTGLLSDGVFEKFQQMFAAHRLNDEHTRDVIAGTKRLSNYIADPHTAVGLGVAAVMRAQGVIAPSMPLVTLSTAHPAKFPDAVAKATGVQPYQPDIIIAQKDLPERYEVLANDFDVVANHIKKYARVVA